MKFFHTWPLKKTGSGCTQSPSAAHAPLAQYVVHAPASDAQAAPAGSHVSTVSALQRFAPGAHAPVHRPDAQLTGQVSCARYAVPDELHCSTTRPLQRGWPGVQLTSEVHAPLLHPSTQADVETQATFTQVCTSLLGPQRTVSLMHATQPPLLQVKLVGQLCAALQFRQPEGCIAQTWKAPEPEHCCAPEVGQLLVHAQAPPPEQVSFAAQLTAGAQSRQPFGCTEQTWYAAAPEHCRAPAEVQASVQLTAQLPPEQVSPLRQLSEVDQS